MEKLIFSQSGVFRLQRLATQFHHLTGTRHRLSSEQAVIALLRDCAKSSNKTIQSYLAAFTSELNAEQVHSLSSKGINPKLTITNTPKKLH